MNRNARLFEKKSLKTGELLEQFSIKIVAEVIEWFTSIHENNNRKAKTFIENFMQLSVKEKKVDTTGIIPTRNYWDFLVFFAIYYF